jgi:hypothetical protein
MEKSKIFGLWAEHYGEGYPALCDQVTDVLSKSESICMANYLRSCPVWIASPGVVYSPFQDNNISGTGSILTDGIWAWSDTMAYYVFHYRISPPSDFVCHVKNRKYIRPTEIEVNVSSLEYPEFP